MRTGRRARGMLLLVKAWALVLACLCGGMPALSQPNQVVPPRDWFHVIRIDSDTYALSEPKYWQANVSYLLLGSRRALLFDTGPGIYDIGDVVRGLTALPVTVIPSHFHFEH